MVGVFALPPRSVFRGALAVEGHGGLPSAADMQGKSPPLPPALPPSPVRAACDLSPAGWLSLPTFPNSCAWLIPRRRQPSLLNWEINCSRETTFNWKTKLPPGRAQEAKIAFS